MTSSTRKSVQERPNLFRQVYRKALNRWRFFQTSCRNTRVRPSDLDTGAVPATLCVAWVLAGNEWLGSARLKGILLDRYFRQQNSRVLSRIAYMPETNYLDAAMTWRRRTWRPILRRGVDVVCFQTRTGATEAFLQDCRVEGVAKVFSISDLDVESIPEYVWKLLDAVVVSSALLAERVGKIHPRVVLIDDPIDVPDGSTITPSSSNNKDLALTWVGHPDRWQDVSFVRQVLDCGEFTAFHLNTISRHPQATYQWTPQTAWLDARRGDVAVVPADMSERGMAKSSNRLVCFMALGFPVIATPISAYRAHIRQGENGFLATTVEEWRECLRRLRDPAVRKRVGENARETATVKALRIPVVAARWQELFESLTQDRCRGD